jgi:hypothetical protein
MENLKWTIILTVHLIVPLNPNAARR